MGVNIHIPADEVWSFFHKNKDRLTKEMVAIAENTDTEYAVYLTEDSCCSGYPMFAVCKGDKEPEYEEGAINQSDCTETAKKCYIRYLFPVIINDDRAIPEDNDDEEMTAQEMQDNAYEREDELRLALCDFLQVVLQEGNDGTDIMDMYGSAFVDEVLDGFLENLSLEHCIPIYRPMFLTDEETGDEVYTEYPYLEPEESGGGWG